MQCHILLLAASLLGSALALQVSCESAGTACSYLEGPCGAITEQIAFCSTHCNSYRSYTPCCGTEEFPTLECGGPPTA
ncbi:hypothetical protein BUE80_DR003146 [Diplocarpon rosae]|nr:hypothetical protein BUE80_DR003146 [Diplocarpon rosae]